MPPIHKPLKNDGPACRVCGCTEHNACLMPVMSQAGIPVNITCSWVKTRGADAGPLCTSCAGTAEDLAEAIQRATACPSLYGTSTKVLRAARGRYLLRKKEVDATG